MLTAVMQLGEYVLNNRGTETGGLLQVIENPNEKGNYNHVLKISFDLKDEDISYRGIEYEEFSSEKIKKYAYKKGSSRGGDITPTSKYTEPEKTLNKIIISLNDIINTSNQIDSDQRIFKKIQEYISSNQENIKNDISEKSNPLL